MSSLDVNQCNIQRQKVTKISTPIPRAEDPSLSIIDGKVSDGESLIISYEPWKRYPAYDLLLISTPNAIFPLENPICKNSVKGLETRVPPLKTRSPINPPLSNEYLVSSTRKFGTNTHLPFSIQIPTNHGLKQLHAYPKKMYIPWWEVFVAVDISTTMLIKDVDWATCQWMPVPWGFSGGTLSIVSR